MCLSFLTTTDAHHESGCTVQVDWCCRFPSSGWVRNKENIRPQVLDQSSMSDFVPAICCCYLERNTTCNFFCTPQRAGALELTHRMLIRQEIKLHLNFIYNIMNEVKAEWPACSSFIFFWVGYSTKKIQIPDLPPHVYSLPPPAVVTFGENDISRNPLHFGPSLNHWTDWVFFLPFYIFARQALYWPWCRSVLSKCSFLVMCVCFLTVYYK